MFNKEHRDSEGRIACISLGLQQFWPLRPERPIQSSILDSFGDMLWDNRGSSFEVRNCPGNFKDTIMSPSRQTLLSHGPFKQAFAIGREFTERTNVTRPHLRIAIELLALARRESGQLKFTGTYYTVADFGRAFWFGAGAQLLVVHRGNVDMNIDAVGNGPDIFDMHR